MRKIKHAILVALVAVGGCTSNSTRLAIQGYRETQAAQQQLLDNTIRIAKEQSYVAMTEYIKLHPGDAKAQEEAIRAELGVQQTMEETRVQQTLQRAKSDATVGRYLYDRQGWLNVLGGDVAQDVDRGAKAAIHADQTAGVRSVRDLIPTTQKSQ